MTISVLATVTSIIGVISSDLVAAISWLRDSYQSFDTGFRGLASALVGALIAATVAWRILRVNAGINLRNKRIDVVLHCNSRYEDLHKLRMEVESDVYAKKRRLARAKVDAYFRRYWGLKSDQFDYWLAGYIDPETITSTFMSIVRDLETEGSRIGGKSYDADIPDMKKRHSIVDPKFVEIVDFIRDYVLHISDGAQRYTALVHYLRIVERDGRGIIAWLTRNSHSRLTFSEFSLTMKMSYRKEYEAMSPAGPVEKFWRSLVTLFLASTRGRRASSSERQLNRLKTTLAKRYPNIGVQTEDSSALT